MTLINCTGGYLLDRSNLPSDATVSGYTGNTGDVLTIRIPKSYDSSAFTLTATGIDNQTDASLMRDITPTVIFIPPKPEAVRASKRQLRVAAYCRVSTDDEEQLTSYEAQKNYYTDKIMTNKEWTMAGIFADEGITGTSARKRPEFLRMIRQCKQGKIEIKTAELIQFDFSGAAKF